MTSPLNAQHRTSVQDTLDFLGSLIDCYKSLPADSQIPTLLSPVEEALDELKGLLAEGEIDIETERLSVKASADRNGIHLNDATLGLIGALNVDDCEEGWFGYLWELISVLFHELYHYRHHIGFGGAIKALPDLVFGSIALMLGSALGETHRTWLWKERRAYHWAHMQMQFLEHMLFMVCLGDTDCVKCCENHKNSAAEARVRQDPHGNIGN